MHGPGVDEPLVWYEGAGTASRRWLHADGHGSIIAVVGSSGGALAINSYDAWGIPAASNMGRFLSADPLGYGDGMNMYAYVGNDPVNFTDPSTGSRIAESCKNTIHGQGSIATSHSGSGMGLVGAGGGAPALTGHFVNTGKGGAVSIGKYTLVTANLKWVWDSFGFSTAFGGRDRHLGQGPFDLIEPLMDHIGDTMKKVVNKTQCTLRRVGKDWSDTAVTMENVGLVGAGVGATRGFLMSGPAGVSSGAAPGLLLFEAGGFVGMAGDVLQALGGDPSALVLGAVRRASLANAPISGKARDIIDYGGERATEAASGDGAEGCR